MTQKVAKKRADRDERKPAGKAAAKRPMPAKVGASDGLADDQRNPLAPPINITANS